MPTSTHGEWRASPTTRLSCAPAGPGRLLARPVPVPAGADLGAGVRQHLELVGDRRPSLGRPERGVEEDEELAEPVDRGRADLGEELRPMLGERVGGPGVVERAERVLAGGEWVGGVGDVLGGDVGAEGPVVELEVVDEVEEVLEMGGPGREGSASAQTTSAVNGTPLASAAALIRSQPLVARDPSTRAERGRWRPMRARKAGMSPAPATGMMASRGLRPASSPERRRCSVRRWR